MSKDKTVRLKIKECSWPSIKINYGLMLEDISAPTVEISFNVQNDKGLIKQLKELGKTNCWECDMEIIFRQKDYINAKKRKRRKK